MLPNATNMTGDPFIKLNETPGQQLGLEILTRGKSMGLFMSMFKEILSRLDRIEEKINGASFQVMSCEEAAKYIKVSKSHIYKLTSQDLIPYYKPSGKKLYFNKGDLDGWIKHGRVLTKDEISEVADVWLSRSGRGRRPSLESTRTPKG
jgi:excisionase family DNA binding protein